MNYHIVVMMPEKRNMMKSVKMKMTDSNSDFLQRENLLRQRLFLSLKLKIEK